MNMTHPARRNSGTTVVPMTRPKPEPVAIEITAGDETTFSTKSHEMAKAFLGALGQAEVTLMWRGSNVQTGADIALLMLERETV